MGVVYGTVKINLNESMLIYMIMRTNFHFN